MLERQLKVAQILLRDCVGGAESMVEALNHALNEDGHESEVHYLDPAGCSTGKVSRLVRLRRLTAGGRRPHYDVVIAHSALPILYAGWAGNAARPLIAVLHSASDDYRSVALRQAHRVVVRRIDRTVAVSESQAARYLARFPSAAKSLSVIENGVDVARFRPRGPSIESSPLRLVTATRLVRFKRIELAIRAASELVRTSSLHVNLSVLGEGDSDYVQMLRDEASRARHDRLEVQFLGERCDVDEVLRGSHFLIHCSEMEGFSVALVEAAACGLPLVLSNRLESAPSGAAIRRFEDGDVSSIARVLLDMANHLEIVTHGAIDAAARVRERYSIQRTSTAYIALARQLADARPRAR